MTRASKTQYIDIYTLPAAPQWADSPDDGPLTVRVQYDVSRWPAACYRCYAYIGEQCMTYSDQPARTHVGRYDAKREGA